MTTPQQPYPTDGQTPNRPLPVGGTAVPNNAAPNSTARPVPISQQQAGSARPIPAGQAQAVGAPVTGKSRANPIPVRKMGSPTQIVQDTDDEDEDEDDLHGELEDIVKKTPPWLISTAFHLILVVILAFITWVLPGEPDSVIMTPEEEDVWAEELGEQVEWDNINPSPEMDAQEEAMSESDRPPVDDPLATPPEDPAEELDATSMVVDSAAADLGMALDGRQRGRKSSLLAAYGGNKTTEAAVLAALRWLKRKQLKSGLWSLAGKDENNDRIFPNGGDENLYAATAMALLAFQGAGYSHQSQKVTSSDKKKKNNPNEFLLTVQKGWAALLKKQGEKGEFFDGNNGHNRLYTHAQCTIALCELYGMTKDPKLKAPAVKAISFCIGAQQPTKDNPNAPGGGWRYEPRKDSDLSVTGWFVMALQSAKMAGLKVPQKSLDDVTHYLDLSKVKGNDGVVRYRYNRSSTPNETMTAEALLCRQYLGWKRTNKEMLDATKYILERPINYNAKRTDVYYWYYATQVTHHLGGRYWNEWNRVMRVEVPKNQVPSVLKNGKKNPDPERGSWWPTHPTLGHATDEWGSLSAGRLYVTCLSTYMLEVYYRHLPIYKHTISR